MSGVYGSMSNSRQAMTNSVSNQVINNSFGSSGGGVIPMLGGDLLKYRKFRRKRRGTRYLSAIQPSIKKEKKRETQPFRFGFLLFYKNGVSK